MYFFVNVQAIIASPVKIWNIPSKTRNRMIC